MSQFEKGAGAAVSAQPISGIVRDLPEVSLHSFIHLLFTQSRACDATSATRTTTTIAPALW